MGAPMARNALKAGFAVTVTNRTPARSDIVVTMVPNTPDVEAAVFGPDGVAAGARNGALLIDMSTISPAATRAFAERAAKNRPPFHTLDAPVSGGELGAIEARLSIMIGGEEADVK